MAEIYAIAEDFRAALLKNERAAAVRLARAYNQAWTALQANIAEITRRIESARAAGEEVNADWLRRQARYRALLDQVAAELAKFADLAAKEITKEQRAAVRTAQRDAERLLLAATGEPPGVDLTFNRLPVKAFESQVGFLSDGSPLANLLGELGPAARKAVEASLLQAVALGQNPRKTAAKIREALGGNLTRALRIARTETIRSYREATHQTFEANAEVLDGWTWNAALNGRTCAACIALHGTFHKTEERMASHVQCFPAGTIVAAPDVLSASCRWFEGEIVELETARGYRLRVTPNHPILTPQGWVFAGLLHDGSDVLSSLDPQRMIAAIHPNDHQVPALIEEVFRSLREMPDAIRRRVPAATENFHGDGEGGEVDIVDSNRFLGNAFNAEGRKPLLHKYLAGGDMDLPPFTRSGKHAFNLPAFPGATNSVMGGLSVAPIFFRCSMGHHQTIGLQGISSRYAGAEQARSNHIPRDLKLFGNRFFRDAGMIKPDDFINRKRDHFLLEGLANLEAPQGFGFLFGSQQAALQEQGSERFQGGVELARRSLQAFPGNVAVDRILKIGRRSFRGHVYNLQTEKEWYSANNIIVHNCRCTQIPRTKSWEELGITGLPDTRPPIVQGSEWFAAQPAAVQQQILGSPAALAAYQKGEVKLEDFVGRRDSTRWGPSYYALSLGPAKAGRGQFPVNALPVPTVAAALPQTAAPGPAGLPIAPALKLPKRGALTDAGKHALGAIAAVHGDGELPVVPVVREASRKRHGAYFFLPLDRSPRKITANPSSDHPELTLVHEIGHFLDHQGLKTGKRTSAGFASPVDPRFEAFRAAARDSQAIQEILRLSKYRAVEVKLKSGLTIQYPIDRRYLAYLLTPEEVWARAYAQYVALRSGDGRLRAQLDGLRQRLGQIYYPVQWDEADFEPIAAAIDDLMRELGWRK